MVKAPVAGRVKTRLAREVGVTEAVRTYRALTTSLLRRVGRDPRWRTILAVAPDHHLRSRFWPTRLRRMAQGPGDLGQRMGRVFAQSWPGEIVLVGSDVPGIRARHIAEAFRSLGRHPVVFGPAEDGGYWLVGMRRRPRTPRIFERVRWSSAHALADTRRNVGGPSGTVQVLSDLDDAADWRRWRRA